MDFKLILENKPLLYGIIGAIVVVLTISIAIGIAASTHSTNGKDTANEKVIKEELDLLTTDNLGKAIEIQALLAREGIDAERKLDGTKSTLYLKNYKQSERDRALLAIVKSGLMDQNVGLEIFDKGDFTSTKEDKKIRLARAINGELSRLIRKIPPIDDASVFVSIPEQTMFTSMQKPVTATVQVTIPSGDKLDQSKVKAITNLLLGSVTGLTSENISITDTNGNVYTSIINAEDELLQKIQENDKYMQQKVAVQLDRLIGKGNYVTTVSTFLTQAPIEKFSIIYDPERKASVNEQTFTEGLGDQTQDTNKGTNAVSVYLPNGLPANGTDSSQNRSYSRSAKETQYGVTKTQVNEYMKPGMVQEISIAVTMEQKALPANTTIEELKELIANAASPMAKAENVTIAFSDSTDPLLAGDRAVNLPKPDESGNPWWLAVVILVAGLAGGLKFISGKTRSLQEKQRKELASLKEKSTEQDRQLRDMNLKAAELLEKQAQMSQGLIEVQQRDILQASREPLAVGVNAAAGNMQGINLDAALSDLADGLGDFDDEEMGETIKSWIEQG